MMLYVNGDSHAAAGEAVVPYCFAEDDYKYFYMGRAPHPENIKVSFGKLLASTLKAKFVCEAESASSNARIIRTTKEFIERENNDRTVVLIGWSTWERVEWQHEGRWWQITGNRFGKDWPMAFQDRYREWVAGLDFDNVMNQQQEQIWELHCWLNSRGVDHLFFNSFESLKVSDQRDWGDQYLAPYDTDATYFNWLEDHGFKTVTPESYHYGADAHRAWAAHLLPHLTKKFS